jgi:hypothetical protein
MDRDSSNVISDIKNKIDFNQVYERPEGKFLAKKKLIAKITTLNPNTGIDQMHSFHVKEKKKYTVAKVAIAVLAGIVIGSRR